MGWSASISISAGQGVQHLIARVDGDSYDDAKVGTQLIFDAFTKGRETYIRAVPDVVSERDFDTKIVWHRGFVRFSFADHAGPHHVLDPRETTIGLSGVIIEPPIDVTGY